MGSLWSWWMLWAGATLMWGLTQEASMGSKTTGGEEFLGAFLQNYQPGYSAAYLHLLISSLSESPASVSVLSRVDEASQKVTVKPGESVIVNISSKAEMVGSNIFQHVVVVHSDHRITVQAINAKPNTAEVTVLRPVNTLGTEYFVLTPPGSSAKNLKEFAVVAGAAGAAVSIQLKGAAMFQNKFYASGSVMHVTLESYAVAQIQGEADFSGSKITANNPVAVFSGHSCAQKHTSCNHVIEQLLPTSSWGTKYVIPSLTSQTRYDLAYVVASQATKLTYNHGGTTGTRGLQSGDVAEFEIRPSRPLYLTADVGIQVLLFGTGATRDGVTYDPYLVLVPDVAAYCPAYVVNSVPGLQNLVLVVAPTKATERLTMDKSPLATKVRWDPVPGSEFSYAEVDLGTAGRTHLAEATINFGLLTFGLADAVGFGTAAACGRTVISLEKPSCEDLTCKPGLQCQVVDGKAMCMAEPTATCRAQGDPHYITFDGRRYDMMGTCLYTMAELCGTDPSLPAFSVEAKNEHRGSRKVSYVGFVTVRAYSHSVSLARGEVGFARIDNQRSRLPVSLSEGRLRVYQSGTRAVVELDFGLVVNYDWDCQLSLSLPAKFQDQVCGLCGNYNGDPTDDFLTPYWEQASDPVEFAQSWKLDDGDYLCQDGCQDNCPSCTPGQVQHYEGDKLCGMLTLSNGPFAACHASLNPWLFLEDCVYDLCVVGGDRLSLCRSLSSYAQACLELGITVGDWRSLASCPLSCPANSRYELCGPACPTTCNPLAVPANCSALQCVEGCVCLPGFASSGGACVPTSSCGCIFEGRPLAPGQEVWADELCKRRCVCDGATLQVRCSDTQGCPPGERCLVQNGLLGCYPNSFGSCQASGDPHYVSFDGRRFDFMGTCTYLLAGSCGQNAALPSFQVLVENEHRGSQTVSYTRAVRVKAHGVKVEVRRENKGQVLVDDVLQYLPFHAADGKVQVFQQGNKAVVRTDFGLTVTYDWNAHVTVKVPSSYAEALCGLCGNFNGDVKDDLALRGGGQATSVLAFGNSWQEETRPGCGVAEPGDCPKLDSMVAEQLQNKKECGILADPEGPFRECHSKLEPQGAVRDCVYDLCLLPGQSGPLCEALAAYAAACQAAGATVYPWRSEEFCPPSCPPHSHYEECSHGCPLTCGDIPVPGGCGSDCYEGCVCDEGFALSGESCVPLASCGCVHQGSYYTPGQTFYPGPSCDSLCRCQEGGLVSCEPSSCGPHEACKPSGGVLGCIAVGSTTCQATGDPHYTTFDGKRYDFMGTCVYILAQTCGARPGLHQFAVLQENEPWGNGKVSVTKAITVQVANYTIRLQQKQWKVTVNGVDMKLPVVLDEGQVRVSQHGSNVVVETHFGLRVSYDLMYAVRVNVPGNYYKQLCGLCGNYNGNPSDDFQKPDGSQASKPGDFGNSWEEKVPGSPCVPPECLPGEDCDSSLECEPDLENKYEQEQFCGLLASPTGPLAACHKLLDPKGPLQDCVFDLCLGGGNLSILCSNIQAYVSACQAAGGHVEPWRTETFCPMACPPNSHYELCADTCSLGCSALSAPPQCPDWCAEGCQCNSGFLSDGQACVPIQTCGCYHNGAYYDPEETVLIDNCRQQCVCHAGKGLVCQDHNCKPDQVCQPVEGVLSCVTKGAGPGTAGNRGQGLWNGGMMQAVLGISWTHARQSLKILSSLPLDPCHSVTCRPQEICKDQGGLGVCVPNYEAMCWLWGDPHYHTFDGLNFDFQGTCSYILATVCPGVNAEGLIPFTVTTKNENRGNPSVSYVRLVTVETLGTNISIHKNEIGKVRVNNVLTTLPVSVAGGRLTVTHGPGKAVLETDFGLQVSYDWNWRVEVTLPSSYHSAVCGLCGNMDKNPSNDQVFPNGTQAPSIPTWGGSWRVPVWDPLCWDECQGSCPTCPEEQLEEYRGPGFCGPLAPGSGGPFTACHAHVPPESFFKGCVLDVCLGGGAQDILCQALAAYAAACQAAGVTIGDWREQAGCAISCPDNSHYELCGPPCPASCPAPVPSTPPDSCEGPCAEGCQCNPGFVLSADRCVPLDGGCGCWANGTYHEAGSEFWADGTCSQWCHCGPQGGSVVCKPASCGQSEECALQPSGQHGCQPISTAECQAWGDPHYVSLDGHRFDFQGTCEYLLSAPCHAPPKGTENFTVTVANEHRGSQAVSYTRSVTLHIYGHSLTLSARWPKQLQVDNKVVALPFQLDSRLSAYLSGGDVVVTTAAGISLSFDGDSFVRLHVPAAYAGALCGLCGNYNKNPKDDLQAVDGNPAGWQVGGAPDCGECVPGPCPQQCTPEEQAAFGGPDACGVISAPEGPLAPCHSLVPPETYFQACLLDACQAEGHPGVLCPAVAAYVALCQAAGAQLGEWRRPDFCPLQCPAHSHYELCGNSCPVSCPSLSAPEGCKPTCHEGCVCDAGFVLSGDTCVPVGQCGCLHNGQYYPLGESFYPGPECERRCECGPGGVVHCQEGAACGPYEECKVENGIQACHATGCGRCLASGGTHYVTLDGRVYDLHGSCSYVLAQVCRPQPGDEVFTIVLEKDATGEPQHLLVTVASHVVSLARGLQVTVDNEAVTLPVSVGPVRVTAEGRNMILQTTKGLRLLFDGDAHVLMSIPSPFHGRLCGLCGNFNGNWSDDFVLPNGNVAPSVEAFGAAWRAPGSSPGCGEGCGAQGCRVCSAEETAPYESIEACGRLRDPLGAFGACHAVLSPSEYFRQCVYDMCAQNGDNSALCRSLAAYTAACQAAGTAVKPWRTNSFCPLQCPAHSHYSICTHSCRGSCAALSGLTGCTTRCFEGCECDDRFLLSHGVCVPTYDCGCTHDGRYLPVNSSLMTSDCSERCSCSASTGLTCQAASCSLERICEVQAGTRECWHPHGLCSLSADANLTTFDGAQNVVSSPGIYELSTLCPGQRKTSPWYRVVTNVQPCHGKAEAVGLVHIFFQNGLVTVTLNHGVWVNGLRVTLPAEVLTSVSVNQSPDGTVLVHQKAGVQVSFGTNGNLAVMVGNEHAGMLCGACGNFDGDQSNDGHDTQEKKEMEVWRAWDFSPW
ncbi:PREDICTED: IgGFc-binding protein [Elephantulus edwardii]|uniref:IgGFc-binding protein n=1 Tax=Elephantulus edwardii TaxID=28737 RepID=UPI0003F0CD88|nr:PREDICTED: IgGFc-binding protein [Elephantulus edwardii]